MLQIQGLTIKLANSDNYILRNVSFDIKKGELFAIAGESGSGKSVLAKSILGLIKYPLKKTEGTISFFRKQLENENDFKSIRGKRISMIFQNPTVSLNPVLSIGNQLIETIMLHRPVSKEEAKEIAIELLKDVEIDFPKERLSSYPFNLSGGMNQRIMIAMALASNPDILIADEPTTALDVTTQSKIINLLLRLKEEKDLSIILISHDLSLVELIADRVMILYAGEILEFIDMNKSKNKTYKHPYSIALRKSVPEIDNDNQDYLYSIPGNIEPNSSFYDNKCIFYKRCEKKFHKCEQEKPAIKHNVRCFLYE